MRVFDIPVLRDGNVIELVPLGATEPKKLSVVEACSGIRSLMTMITLAVVFAYFTRPGSGSKGTGIFRHYGFWRALAIVLLAIPIAVLTNAFRVSGTGVLSRYYGTGVAEGFFHSFSGWVVYLVAFALLLGTVWLLDRIVGRYRSGKGSGGVRDAESGVGTKNVKAPVTPVISVGGADQPLR